jgi:hypothetical protein
MSVERDNLAKQSSIFSFTYKLARRTQFYLKPVFSISFAHSCAFSGLAFFPNPFVFCRLRASRDNYRGWGCPALSPTAFPIRVYPRMGVYPERLPRVFSTSGSPRGASFSPPPTLMFSISYKRVRKPLKTSDFKYLYLHTHTHSFVGSLFFSTTSQKHTGGIPKNCPILGSSPLTSPSTTGANGRRGGGRSQGYRVPQEKHPLGNSRIRGSLCLRRLLSRLALSCGVLPPPSARRRHVSALYNRAGKRINSPRLGNVFGDAEER